MLAPTYFPRPHSDLTSSTVHGKRWTFNDRNCLTDWKSEFLQETSKLIPQSVIFPDLRFLHHLPPGPLIRYPCASLSVRCYSLQMLHRTSWLWSWQGHNVNIFVFPTPSSKSSCLWSVLKETLQIDTNQQRFLKIPLCAHDQQMERNNNKSHCTWILNMSSLPGQFLYSLTQ